RVGEPHLIQRLKGRGPGERRATRYQVVEDGPEGVHIRRRTDIGSPGRLLWCGVIGSSEEVPRSRQAIRSEVLRETKVGQVRAWVRRPEAARRLDRRGVLRAGAGL